MRAFTLLEMLVSIAIVSVLAGILFAVMGQAKRKALDSDTLDRLHQLAVAGQLYESSYGSFPLGTEPLVRTGLVPTRICASREDNTAEGIANEMLQFGLPNAKKLSTSYRNSFIGPREYQLGARGLYERFASKDPSGGWLVDLTPMEKTELMLPGTWTGRYRRLMNDGSVQMRTKKLIPCGGAPEGGITDCYMPILFFVDPGEELLQWAKSLK